MKPMHRGGWIAVCVTILAALPAAAGEKAVNLALISPIALVKPEDSVSAFRFSLLYGKNASVKIVDLGLVNHTTTLSHGLQMGFVNYTENAGGLQLAVLNYAHTLDGLQVGVINIIKEGGFLPVCIIANWSKK